MNEPSNTGLVEQSTQANPLSDDEENTALQGAGITHQPDAEGKETFEKLYFERYPSLHGPGDPKYEEALKGSIHGQFVPEQDHDTRQCQVPVVVIDHRMPPLRVAARKNFFEKRVTFEPSTKSSLGLYSYHRQRLDESNQPLDYSLARDDKVPLGVDLHDNYLSIDDEFDLKTKYSMNPDFVTGC